MVIFGGIRAKPVAGWYPDFLTGWPEKIDFFI